MLPMRTETIGFLDWHNDNFLTKMRDSLLTLGYSPGQQKETASMQIGAAPSLGRNRHQATIEEA